MPFPDLSSFYPGYERKNSDAERRQTQVWVVIRATLTRVTTRFRFGRGSLVGVPPRLWLRRPNATTQPQSTDASRRPPVGRTTQSCPGADCKAPAGTALARRYGLPATARPNHGRG